MKKIMLILLALFGFALNLFAQSDIKLRHKYGAESADLQSYLYFEDVKLERLSFTGSDLKDKDYQIFIKKYVSGKLAQTDTVFDSKQDSYFKINDNHLDFRVFAKRNMNDTVKFDFQFNGFSQSKEYKVTKNQKEFALKNFLGSKPEQSILLNDSNYILTFMMPYIKKDGETTYCDVVQSGAAPEELGKKYPIPLYFLIDIKFQ